VHTFRCHAPPTSTVLSRALRLRCAMCTVYSLYCRQQNCWCLLLPARRFMRRDFSARIYTTFQLLTNKVFAITGELSRSIRSKRFKSMGRFHRPSILFHSTWVFALLQEECEVNTVNKAHANCAIPPHAWRWFWLHTINLLFYGTVQSRKNHLNNRMPDFTRYLVSVYNNVNGKNYTQEQRRKI
jgi:hypothetical protein